jgi:hypothetical protein
MPAASAEYVTASKVYLLDDDGTALSNTTDWYCTVERVGYVSNDGEMELNLTVTMVLYNGTGAANLTHNFTVQVTITDSDSTTVMGDVDLYVSGTMTGYIVISNVSLATLVEDSNATIGYSLLDADDSDARLDLYAENIHIVTDRALGPIVAMIPVLISVMVLMAVFSVLGGAFGKMNSAFGMRSKKGKK